MTLNASWVVADAGWFGGNRRPSSPAEVFWQNLQRLLPLVGVTRVADVTWLDDVGIPCAQAIRPQARTLSVAQGKGPNHLAAATSAAMEAIEVWHAENLPESTCWAPAGKVAAQLNYPLEALRLNARRTISPGTIIEWTPADVIGSTTRTQVPTAALRLNSVVSDGWAVSHFHTSSNGLASGVTWEGALRHALYEVIERDTLHRCGANRTPIELATLPVPARRMAEMIRDAGHNLIVELIVARLPLPTFVATLECDDFAVKLVGSGADADPIRAVCQAIAEAAQARVAAIAGTREDISGLARTPVRRPQKCAPVQDRRAWTDLCPPTSLGPRPSIPTLARSIEAAAGHAPMVVDLQRVDIGLPVAKVVCPGLDCPPGY